MKQILLVVLLVALTNCCFFNIWKLPKHNFGPLNCKPAPQPQPQPAPRPQIEGNRFILTFEYAAREGHHLDDSRGNVLWNGVVVYSVTPCDYEIRTVSIEVKAQREDNVLEFEGSGCSNAFGLTIDNVRLVRKGTSRDLIVNGGFERPCLHEDWIYTEKIEGWEGHRLEIGKGRTYNCRWNSQVAELDSDRNYRLTQRLHIDLHGCY